MVKLTIRPKNALLGQNLCDCTGQFTGTTCLSPTEKQHRKRALISFSLFHFLDDGFSDCIYLLLPFITTELGLSFTMVGVLRGTSSISTGIFQVPLSLLGERIGEVTVLAVGTFGMALGFLFLSRAYTFLTILFSLLLGKVTGAGQHGLSSSALSRIFEESGRRAAMGTYNFSGDLGKVCVPFLLTLMINLWGWRNAVSALSIGGLLASGFLYLFVSKANRARVASVPPSRSTDSNRSKGRGWKEGSKRRFISLSTIGVIDIAARYSLLTFLPFLLLRKGIAVTEFGFALTLLFAGGAAGKFVCGILAEWVGVLPMVMDTEILTTM